MKHYDITIKVLEDLHVGTGLGFGEIDDTQIRDSQGRPLIPSTHIKGLLREALQNQKIDAQRIHALLGQPGGQRGALSLTSAYLSSDVEMLIWGSTRINANTGTALEDTLRFFEYVPAGAQFHLQAQLEKEELGDLFRQALAHCTHLGKGKSRGHGRIRWALTEKPVDMTANTPFPSDDSRVPIRLRLILRNLEPLNLASTTHPGNLMPTMGWISGSALKGAIMQALIQQNRLTLANHMSQEDILWAPAYPLPHATENTWETLTVAPIPLSTGTPKQQAPGLDRPWWWHQTSSQWLLGQQNEQDMLSTTTDTQPQEKLKRPKPLELICQPDKNKPWFRYQPKILQRLRTRIPDANQPQALFSQEEIAEQTTFCADLLLTTAKAKDTMYKALSHLQGWLRLGRGGRPVEICQSLWLPLDYATNEVEGASLTLWIHSDLIVRDSWLRFHNRLDKAALKDLLGENACNWDTIEVKSRSDQNWIQGFNATAGLPHTPRLAIRAGSVAHIHGPSDELERLRKRLASQPAWGEMRHEGLGRIKLNALPQFNRTEPTSSQPFTSSEQNQNESIFAEARQWAEKLNWLNGIAKTQLDNARDYVLAVPEQDIITLFDKIDQASQKHGSKDWEDVIKSTEWKSLRQAVESHPHQRKLLDCFFRWCRVKKHVQNHHGGEQ